MKIHLARLRDGRPECGASVRSLGYSVGASDFARMIGKPSSVRLTYGEGATLCGNCLRSSRLNRARATRPMWTTVAECLSVCDEVEHVVIRSNAERIRLEKLMYGFGLKDRPGGKSMVTE